MIAALGACKKKEASPRDRCAAQQFTKTGMACCGAAASFYWNGYRCVDGSNELGKCGCSCEGPDCGKQFPLRDECLMAFAGCPIH